MSTHEPAITTDDVFELLSSRRRRLVVTALDRRDGCTVSELAELVAAQENQTARYALSESEVKRMYVSLYQVHLPKLEDYGVVKQRNDGSRYELGSVANELLWYLEHGPREPEFREDLNL